MKLAASAFALLLATGVAAYAQGTGMAPPSKSATPTSSDQCWDMATNSVKASQAKTLAQGPSGTSSTGNSAPAVNPSTPPGAAGSASTTGAAPTTRPAGMPTC
jgi:hypothetical protein